MKLLILYYTLSGNTKELSELIRTEIGYGEIEEIKPLQPYPSDSKKFVELVRKELKSKTGPEITNMINDPNDFDAVLIGTPNWGNTMAPAIRTYLKKYHITSKIIIPMITHGGTGLGDYVKELKQLTTNCTFKQELVIKQKDITKEVLYKWIKDCNL